MLAAEVVRYYGEPVALAAGVLTALAERTDLDTSTVDDVVLGCVSPLGEQGGVISRAAALTAGWHTDAPGVQLNRFCGSGLEAVNTAAAQVRSGGVLVYSTCTISPRENEERVDALVAARPDFAVEETERTLPHRDRTDGFFLARLRRRA